MRNLVFQVTFLKLGDFWGYGSWHQMKNFSTISPKLCHLGQKTPKYHNRGYSLFNYSEKN